MIPPALTVLEIHFAALAEWSNRAARCRWQHETHLALSRQRRLEWTTRPVREGGAVRGAKRQTPRFLGTRATRARAGCVVVCVHFARAFLLRFGRVGDEGARLLSDRGCSENTLSVISLILQWSEVASRDSRSSPPLWWMTLPCDHPPKLPWHLSLLLLTRLIRFYIWNSNSNIILERNLALWNLEVSRD